MFNTLTLCSRLEATSDFFPQKAHCAIYLISAVALVVLGALGISRHIPAPVVASSYLVLGFLPEVLVLTHAKSAGAWSLFFTIFVPIIAGLGGSGISGKLSLQTMGGLALGLGAFKLGLSASFFAHESRKKQIN